jgi:hypothetical protein
MRNLMLKLWKDDCGALLSTEWIFVCVIIVLGSITGMVLMRNAVISELVEFGQAVEALNVGYSFSGQANCESSTNGSQAIDDFSAFTFSTSVPDTFDFDDDAVGVFSEDAEGVNPTLTNRSIGASNPSFVDVSPCD